MLDSAESLLCVQQLECKVRESQIKHFESKCNVLKVCFNTVVA